MCTYNVGSHPILPLCYVGICREQKICKAIRNLGLCFTAIARDCCASCPNVVFPTNATVPSVDVLPFYNGKCLILIN